MLTVTYCSQDNSFIIRTPAGERLTAGDVFLTDRIMVTECLRHDCGFVMEDTAQVEMSKEGWVKWDHADIDSSTDFMDHFKEMEIFDTGDELHKMFNCSMSSPRTGRIQCTEPTVSNGFGTEVTDAVMSNDRLLGDLVSVPVIDGDFSS